MTKEVCSDNCLNKSSWLPNHIKTNFVSNSLKTAENRCNLEKHKQEATRNVKAKLKKNGYNEKDFYVKHKGNTAEIEKSRTCTFLLPFVSDSLNRKIKSLIRKYDLNVRLVNHSSKKLKDLFIIIRKVVSSTKVAQFVIFCQIDITAMLKT